MFCISCRVHYATYFPTIRGFDFSIVCISVIPEKLIIELIEIL